MSDGIDALSRGASAHEYGFRFTGREVDLFGAEGFGGEDDGLFFPLGHVDGGLALAFALEDLRAFGALGGDLAVHGADDLVGGVDVADLVAEADDAPVSGGFVDGFGDVGVEGRAFAEDVVERQAADLAAHGRLGELGDGVFGVFDAVAGFVGVEDAGVEDAVEFEGDVVGGDGALAGDFHRGFFQAFDVGDAVDDGDEDGDAGFEDAVEFTHSFDYPGGLLGDEADDGVGGEGGSLEVGLRGVG